MSTSGTTPPLLNFSPTDILTLLILKVLEGGSPQLLLARSFGVQVCFPLSKERKFELTLLQNPAVRARDIVIIEVKGQVKGRGDHQVDDVPLSQEILQLQKLF